MIPQSEISRTAARQHKMDKVIEKDYVITWVILGLAESKLKKVLAFKGGTALKKIYFPYYRYSEDLDFTLLEQVGEDVLLDGFRTILDDISKSQGFQFTLNDEKIERRTDTLTFYIDYVGPLQARLGIRDIKVDITLSEQLEFPLKEKPVLSPYSDSKGLRRKLNVYTLEEVLTEKLCALIGRTEPRDLFDTLYLFDLGSFDYQAVAMAFPEKAKSKKVDPKRLSKILASKKSTIERLWENRLAHQVDELPDLEGVIRKTNRFFRQYKL
jgi:predicted nucleotidyltransferase component of viral defense system